MARPGTTVLLISLALAGCGKNDLIGGSVTGGTPPPPSAPATGNRAPSITGTPPSTVKVNQPYDFTPHAFDPDGDTVRFEIVGKPAWASFNANTGRLYGTPPSGVSGTFGGIVIRATDGVAKVSLQTFSIQVLEPAPAVSGSAALSWTRPTTNSDGTPLNDLAGYRIYYGPVAQPSANLLEITDPASTRASIDGLAAGSWYFSMSSYNAAGVESARTNPVSLTIG